MSYYIFRNIHYSIEVYQWKNSKRKSYCIIWPIIFFCLFLLLARLTDIRSLSGTCKGVDLNSEYFSLGLQRILFGVSKIVIIGNYLLTSKAQCPSLATLDENNLWLKTYLETVALVLNAYFQFAGYSDIAIGLSLLLGYRIMENFNYPFLATNMQEFWSKYHMSLSAFCRDYIYTPIASYYRKPVLGIFATMIIIGLWHEISLPYLLWGLMQAGGIYLAFLFKNSSNLCHQKKSRKSICIQFLCPKLCSY